MGEPTDASAWMIEPFGTLGYPRTFPHSGDDWTPINKITNNSPWLATFDGEVIHSGKDSGAGNWIVLETDDLWWVYGHGKEGTRAAKGSVVKEGQYLGTMGMTGFASGVHLHISAYTNRKAALGRFVADWKKGMTVDEWAAASYLVRPSLHYKTKHTAPAVPTPTNVRDIRRMMVPQFHGQYLIIWPNGFANYYNPQVYAALQTYFANYDYEKMVPHPGTTWATSTVLRESQAAQRGLQDWEVQATVDALRPEFAKKP